MTRNQYPVDTSISASSAFVALARSWVKNPEKQFLGLIWQAYDDMRCTPPSVDGRDLERSISQLLEPRISQAMTGDEPFYVQHGSFERETMKPAPAQPPEYDLAFVLRADERMMWPMEAKVLETSKKTAAYVRDVKEEYLTCRYAPFSNSGAMLGFLLSGTPEQTFEKISEELGCTLNEIPSFSCRPNRYSRHVRAIPIGKTYPSTFSCYHLMLEYPDLSRQK